jgi:beta-lactamase class A
MSSNLTRGSLGAAFLTLLFAVVVVSRDSPAPAQADPAAPAQAEPAAPAQAEPAASAQAEEEFAHPWRRRIASAARYARARSGRVSFAVMDEDGRLRGYHERSTYLSASTVKAMLMVTYLNSGSVRGRALRSRDRALLRPMITRSNNARASRVRDIVGNAALTRLARRVGMRDFATAVSWGDTRITAADQARFFARIDRFVVERHRDYARRLLRNIVPSQRWGMPQAVPSGWDIYFKGGWRRTGAEFLVHQIGLFESGPRRISVAVLTDGNPSHRYGRRTIRGTAARLLLRFR